MIVLGPDGVDREDGQAKNWEGFDAPDLPPGWTDSSWHNELCPCYQVGLLHIWLDHPDQTERCDGLGADPDFDFRRFGVVIMYLDSDHSPQMNYPSTGPVAFESDDWAEVLAFIDGCPLGLPMEPALKLVD